MWSRLRNFLNDLNEKGVRREFGRNDKENKLKFMEACDSLDITKKGVLSEQQMDTVLSKIRYIPLP